MRKWIVAVFGMAALQASAATVSQDTAIERALSWMSGNPVMSQASLSVESIETFPDTGSYSVYVVQLAPKGYLILNSDDRLPLTVSFSAESRVDLTDDPQNALRPMLIGYCANMAEKLVDWGPVKSAMGIAVEALLAEDELYGPFLETSWDQSSPYNELCPDVSGGLNGYENRAPVGCVPTTFAQLMNYHRWPYYGTGSRSYTDDSGTTTGAYSADFSDPYDWNSMQSAHSTSDPQASQDAIKELMFELGVATKVDYEAGYTGGYISEIGSRLGEYFFFESVDVHSDQPTLIAPLESELRSGFPCVVSYPGHAFIADGLMVDNGSTIYHFNMGWGGQNNGWYSKDAAPTGGDDFNVLDEGLTSIRPRLMAFPRVNVLSGNAGASAELSWILPRRREDEVSQLAIKQLVQQSGNWQNDASEIMGMSSGWEVVSDGRSGDCLYSGQYGATMVLNEVFVPDATTELTFWLNYLLAEDHFSVSVSTNGGVSYIEVFSVVDRSYKSWSHESISLGSYAGQKILLKFALSVSVNSYFKTGGVWLDELAVSSGNWYDWEAFAGNSALTSERFSEVTTVLDECEDFSVFEETLFDPAADWVVSTSEGVDHCFYKAPPTAWNYGCHLTSRSAITPTAATRLVLRTKYSLDNGDYPENFKVLISTDRTTFTEEVWSASGSAGWADIFIDLSDYAGQEIYFRLAYEFSGGYVVGGGIWVDSISTQEITNPELEGQPIHYSMLSDLPEGTHTLAAVLTDTSAAEHALGPSFTLTVSGAADDGDGMPEAWENRYGLNTTIDDSGLDPDGDGFSHLQEYISGTVPTNGSSFWALTMGSGSLPAFQGLDGRLYTIEYCDGLVSNDWKSIASGIEGSNGLFEVSSYDSATNAFRFYRVTVQEAD